VGDTGNIMPPSKRERGKNIGRGRNVQLWENQLVFEAQTYPAMGEKSLKPEKPTI